MLDDALLKRITVRSEVFGGKPIVRDMRIAVEHVLAMLASGDDADTILQQYPALEAEDIQACLLFAHYVRTWSQRQAHELLAELTHVYVFLCLLPLPGIKSVRFVPCPLAPPASCADTPPLKYRGVI